MQVSVLIVGYHSKDLLRDCLASLLRCTAGVEMEILYVDCSNDGSAEMVRETFSSVRVVENDQNLGFARGNNLLARHATGEFLLLLNPDTIVRDNAVGALLACAQALPECGAWGGVTEHREGGVEPGSRQTAPGLVRDLLGCVGLGSLVKGGLPDDAVGPGDVEVLCGAFMMVRREVWTAFGGLDETFFLYSEEVDLCYRLRKAGLRVVMTPHARIIHLVGSGAVYSPARMLALSRGAVHFDRKHFGPARVWAGVALRWASSFIRYLAGAVGAPLLGADRAALLRERHRLIVTKPGLWSGGWRPADLPKHAAAEKTYSSPIMENTGKLPDSLSAPT